MNEGEIMMQQQPQANPNAQVVSPQAKQPWRKPTLTFVPLQVTAQTSGSGPDGGTFETPPP